MQSSAAGAVPRRRAVSLRILLAIVLAFASVGIAAPAASPSQDTSKVATAPNYPQALSHNPNEMADVEPASPAAGVNLIAAPTPDNTGDARLSYPIELPPGRLGLQPSLSIAYDSSGGNGWLGVGWSLEVPSISVDTRWGVPRYDTGFETETYQLNGDMLTAMVPGPNDSTLTSVAHRGEQRQRLEEQVFAARVDTSFSRIVRHGSSPTEYWWEVTAKDGTTYCYGGTDHLSAPDPGAVLASGPSGNIFRWLLKEVRDRHGNTMVYSYDVVTGNDGAGWRQTYLSRIEYTGSVNSAVASEQRNPAYVVVFKRTGGRTDPVVDCRPGFKTKITERLSAIEIRRWTQSASSPGALVRRYELDYQPDAPFGKSLLSRVTQFGEDGSEFNHHDFTYFDEVDWSGGDASLASFEPAPTITNAKRISGSQYSLEKDSTAFGAERTTSNSGEGRLGMAFGLPTDLTSGHVGAGGASSDSLVLLALIDINGDCLPDQVYRDGSSVYYRPNTGGPVGAPGFATTSVRIPTLSNLGIGHESSSGWSVSGGLFGDIVSGDVSGTKHEEDVYFEDVNGDILPDFVANTKVYFNQGTDSDGRPTFGTLSPVPLGAGALADTSGMVQYTPEERAAIEDSNHLVDPVRRWVAPYDGTVRVSGDVRLLQNPSAGYATADGVRCSIQHNDQEVWSTTVDDPMDHATRSITGLENLSVHAGDRLYFRANSRNDGSFDAVEFNPTITYKGKDTSRVDENGMPIFVFSASDDYSYGGRPLDFVAPLKGEAVLSGTLEKIGPTTDDITVEVSTAKVATATPSAIDYMPVGSALTVGRNATGSFPFTVPIDTSADGPGVKTLLRVFLGSDSRVDLRQLSFTPQLAYSTVEGKPAPVDGNGRPELVFYPSTTSQVFPRTLSAEPYTPYTPSSDGTITVDWGVSLKAGVPADYESAVTLTVKQSGQRVAKQRVTIRAGVIVGQASLNATLPVEAGEDLYFSADVETDEAAGDFQQKVVVGDPKIGVVGAPGGTPAPDVSAAVHLSTAASEAFGGGFRQWSYGEWDGRLSDTPIDEAALRGPDGTETEEELQQFLEQLKFLQMVPLVESSAPGEDGVKHWRMQDEECWIEPETMSPSRLGSNYLDFSDGSLYGGGRGVVKVGRSFNGAGKVGFVLNFGASTGDNWSEIDFRDLNGDRYPDIIGQGGSGKVQFTLPNGALEADRVQVFSGHNRSSASNALSVNVGGGAPVKATSGAGGNLEEIDAAAPAVALGAAASWGEFDGESDLIDMNGDGLPDRVKWTGVSHVFGQRSSSEVLKVQLNLGRGIAPAEFWGPVGGMHYEESFLAGLSAGASFNDDTMGLGGGVTASESTVGTERDLVDVNGDNLPDLVYKDVAVDYKPDSDLDPESFGMTSDGTQITVRLNTGSGFTNETYQLSGALARPLLSEYATSRDAGVSGSIAIMVWPIPPIYVTIGGSYSHGTSLGGNAVNLTDFNGDGYADHIGSDRAGSVEVRLNSHGRTNLLKSVGRPLGGTIQLDYEREGNTTEMPESRHVLSRVDVDDGYHGDGVDTLISKYAYTRGVYDRTERDFLGFEKVVENVCDGSNAEAVYRATVREYRVDSGYSKGLLKRERLFDGSGRPFTDTVNSYLFRDRATGENTTDLSSLTGSRFPMLVRSDQSFFEGQPSNPISTWDTYAYDAYGNLATVVQAGELASSADDVRADIHYASFPSSYIMDRAEHITIRNGGTVLREREAQIDGNAGESTQVREHAGSGQVAVTDLVYNPTGTLSRLTGPANTNGQRSVLEYEYDGIAGTHVTKVTDSFGLVSTAKYDPLHGVLAETVDTNGSALTYGYDAQGRLVSVTGPYEQGGTPTIRFEYHLPGPGTPIAWAMTRQLDRYRDAGDTIDTVQLVDGLGRVLQTKRDASVFQAAPGIAEDVMVASGRSVYDCVGRAVQTFYPVTGPLSTLGMLNTTDPTDRNGDAVPPVRTTYDVLDRVTSETLPNGAKSEITRALGPDREGTTRFETVVKDPNQNERHTYQDVRGVTTGIEQFNTRADGTDETIWTSYLYDAMRQLSTITDANGNETSYAYDLLGRTTSQDSPDSGMTRWTYDSASNVIAKTTANLAAEGSSISYEYDQNRLTAVRYPDFPENNVTYVYGTAGASQNRAGRVVRVTDGSGSEEYSYGRLGETVKRVKTVRDFTSGAQQPSYVTGYNYDSFGRLQDMVYPDGERLDYQYDSGGRVSRVVGEKAGRSYEYVHGLFYDEFENRTYMETGNGVRTRYMYDPLSRRLSDLRSVTPAGKVFQAVDYAYDDVGNVLSLRNNVAVGSDSERQGPITQTFTYDRLYRLTEASGTYEYAPKKFSRYSLDVAYDSISNITAKNQAHDLVQSSGQTATQRKTSYAWDYQYSAGQPHAATSIGDRRSTYDLNGNQLGFEDTTSGTRRTIQWDEENRIRSISDNGQQSSYKYNAAGERVVKRGPQGQTVYVNQSFAVRNGTEQTKHIFLGDSLLTSKLVKDRSPESESYYYHSDHVGSSNYVTDARGQVLEHSEYFPFGEPWVEERTNTQSTPYRFTGKELDEETGLYYYGARYYDPQTSLWQSTDPIVQQPGSVRSARPSDLSVYAYARQNPLKYNDPDGRNPTMPAEKTLSARQFAQRQQTQGYWPPNQGFEGAPHPTTIPKGTIVTRYVWRGSGGAPGSFVSPADVDFDARALEFGENNYFLLRFKVLKPIAAQEGPASEWFGKRGGGIQWKARLNVRQLADKTQAGGAFIEPVDQLTTDYLSLKDVSVSARVDQFNRRFARRPSPRPTPRQPRPAPSTSARQ